MCFSSSSSSPPFSLLPVLRALLPPSSASSSLSERPGVCCALVVGVSSKRPALRLGAALRLGGGVGRPRRRDGDVAFDDAGETAFEPDGDATTERGGVAVATGGAFPLKIPDWCRGGLWLLAGFDV